MVDVTGAGMVDVCLILHGMGLDLIMQGDAPVRQLLTDYGRLSDSRYALPQRLTVFSSPGKSCWIGKHYFRSWRNIRSCNQTKRWRNRTDGSRGPNSATDDYGFAVRCWLSMVRTMITQIQLVTFSDGIYDASGNLCVLPDYSRYGIVIGMFPDVFQTLQSPEESLLRGPDGRTLLRRQSDANSDQEIGINSAAARRRTKSQQIEQHLIDGSATNTQNRPSSSSG